jgi:hypothetical protein
MKSKINVSTGEILADFYPLKSIRSPLDRPHLKTLVEGVSKTEQSHKDKCCINRIMDSVSRTGVLPLNPTGREPQYADVTHLQGDLTNLINKSRDTAEQLRLKVLADKQAAKAAKIARTKKALAALEAAEAAAKSGAAVGNAEPSKA